MQKKVMCYSLQKVPKDKYNEKDRELTAYRRY